MSVASVPSLYELTGHRHLLIGKAILIHHHESGRKLQEDVIATGAGFKAKDVGVGFSHGAFYHRCQSGVSLTRQSCQGVTLSIVQFPIIGVTLSMVQFPITLEPSEQVRLVFLREHSPFVHCSPLGQA
jgi:hypothetical protein